MNIETLNTHQTLADGVEFTRRYAWRGDNGRRHAVSVSIVVPFGSETASRDLDGEFADSFRDFLSQHLLSKLNLL